MRKITSGLSLLICLLLISGASVFAVEDNGGGGSCTPPPYYNPQTAQIAPSYTFTPIYKPPTSTSNINFSIGYTPAVTRGKPAKQPPLTVESSVP